MTDDSWKHSGQDDSLEARLARRAVTEGLLDQRVVASTGYRNVDEYDPVLRSHCRLVSPPAGLSNE